jgi:hypothetical protein
MASVYLFERDARRELGGLQRRWIANPRRLVYELVLDVPTYDEQRTVSIEFPASAAVVPRVLVDGPDDSPHRNADRSLCMYHPADQPTQRWIASDGLGALLDCIRVRLFQEADARAGHGWPGDEAPHPVQPRPHARSRRRSRR